MGAEGVEGVRGVGEWEGRGGLSQSKGFGLLVISSESPRVGKLLHCYRKSQNL